MRSWIRFSMTAVLRPRAVAPDNGASRAGVPDFRDGGERRRHLTTVASDPLSHAGERSPASTRPPSVAHLAGCRGRGGRRRGRVRVVAPRLVHRRRLRADQGAVRQAGAPLLHALHGHLDGRRVRRAPRRAAAVRRALVPARHVGRRHQPAALSPGQHRVPRPLLVPGVRAGAGRGPRVAAGGAVRRALLRLAPGARGDRRLDQRPRGLDPDALLPGRPGRVRRLAARRSAGLVRARAGLRLLRTLQQAVGHHAALRAVRRTSCCWSRGAGGRSSAR